MAAELTTDMTDGLYRRIYAGYLKSRKITKLSLQAEAWFWRLHSIADDYGNLNGDPVLLWKDASGRRDMSVKEAEALTKECLNAGLAYAYYSDEDVFIHIIGFEEKQPAGKNGKRLQKCPMHPETPPILTGESGCIQVNPGESKKIQKNPGESSASHYHSHSNNHSKDHSHSLPSAADAAPVVEEKVRSEKQKARDALWEPLEKHFFPKGTSKRDQTRLGSAVTALQAKSATPEQIPERIAAYPKVMPGGGDCLLTLEALIKHWDICVIAAKPIPDELGGFWARGGTPEEAFR